MRRCFSCFREYEEAYGVCPFCGEYVNRDGYNYLEEPSIVDYAVDESNGNIWAIYSDGSYKMVGNING